jgi:1-acyl-sn-glycerol-3-phosphate acyltransferase
MRLLWYILKPVVQLIALMICRVEVSKEQPSYPQGPLIIVANHLSWADIPFLGITFPRRICFMAKQELFRSPLLSFIIRGVGSFPVHKGQFDRQALRKAQEVLNKGLVLGVFPEGKRSLSARLMSPYPGAALVALHTGAPLLPVGITGTEELERKGWMWRRPRVTLRYGRPFHLPALETRLNRAQLASLSDFIMERIAELLPESYRGVYGGKEKVEDRASPRDGVLLRSEASPEDSRAGCR